MDTLTTTLWIAAVIIAYGIIASRIANNRLRSRANERPSDSICTFGRSLDYRRLDTTVIRAVYEEIQDYLSYLGVRFPIRASDNFMSDLDMDEEDLDDVIVMIGERTGRSLDNTDKNPFYSRVNSVSDLVEFICHQPLTTKQTKKQNKSEMATPRKPSD